MNRHISHNLPTIYADVNVFRYVAYGEMVIDKPERFRWLYSYAHLDAIFRSGNADSLEGMRKLGAVEVTDVLDDQFRSIGNVQICQYIEPEARYEQHLQTISGFEHAGESNVEYLLRIFGADNFTELSLAPDQLRIEVDRLTSGLDPLIRDDLIERAASISIKAGQFIEDQMKDTRSLQDFRTELGLGNQEREKSGNSTSPIDAIWELIGDSVGEVSKQQFFGFEPILESDEIQRTQHGSIAGAYTVLNLLGLKADSGLTRREKIHNAISDSQHVGMASYCNALLSADRKLCAKANAIYVHLHSATRALDFDYAPEGFTLYLTATHTTQ